MKKVLLLILACIGLVVFSTSADAATLATYEFGPITGTTDAEGEPPTNVAADLTASNWDKTGGFYARVGTNDGNPFGDDTRWKYFAAPTAAPGFTITPDGGNEIDFSELSFNIQIDGGAGKIRRLQLTSSATGSTVLYTLWNVIGNTDPNYDAVNHDRLNNGAWQFRAIDLTSIAALQDVTGPVTFTLGIDRASDAGGTNGNFRMDNVTISGDVSLIPEPVSLMLAGFGLMGSMIVRRRGN